MEGKGSWGQKGGCDRESKGAAIGAATAKQDAGHGDEVDSVTKCYKN